MSADPACRAPVPPEGAVPRTCFAHVPAVPVVAVPYVPVPVPSGLPVLSVAGILPDRTGNVDVTRFLEEWAAGPLADKADKAVPLAAGNLASLDASGNLVDSGATPASIKAAAVAEVVANAPGTMDTLKEIADILGSVQQSGTVLKRISDLESGKRGADDLSYAPGDWFVTGAAEMRLVRDGSVQPQMQWSATVAGETWVLLYNGAFWRFGVRGATAEDKGSGADATSLTFDIDGAVYNLAKGGRLALVADVPPAVEVDATLTRQGAAADAKAVGDALDGKRGLTDLNVYESGWKGGPEGGQTYMFTLKMDGRWATSDDPATAIRLEWLGSAWHIVIPGDGDGYGYDSADAAELEFSIGEATWTLVRVADTSAVTDTLARASQVPAKTSQLTNDGDGTNAFVKTNDTRLSDARTPTAHHATHATNGSDPLVPADIGAASLTDLPYRLVEPGKWEFSGIGYDPSNHTYSVNIEEIGGGYEYQLLIDGTVEDYAQGSTDDLLSASFYIAGITATRASLPGHLLDRAGDRVEVTGDTTLTLPAAAVPGHLRDFLVRLEISGSTVPTITFAAPTGETITYETDGDEFPVPDEAGTWLYSFTETAAHKFAVSLKKVNVVAQGGS